MANRGGFSWKRATGVTRVKQNISRATGVPLTKSGRQRKVGKMVTGGGCLLPVVAVLVLALAALLSGCYPTVSDGVMTPAPAQQLTPPAAPVDTDAVTLSEYEQIQEGMTYEQVVEIVGFEGKQEWAQEGETVEGAAPDSSWIYSWTNGDLSYLHVTFEDGLVWLKSHGGLE